MRYFLEIAYNGKAYHGWQVQPNAISVQEVLERSLTLYLRQEVVVVAAGRTDTGVHAKQMWVHFDILANLDLDCPNSNFIYRLNKLLPLDIVAFQCLKVPQTAHARFDAVSRSYEYHIDLYKNPFSQGAAYLFTQFLDIDQMNQASEVLLEHSDFKCFSKSKTDVKTYNCDIKKAYWIKEGDSRLVFYITANRFLRNMVRAIVGTLIEIGLGKFPVSHIHTVIESKDRSVAGYSVPAHGLYLTEVSYLDAIFQQSYESQEKS